MSDVVLFGHSFVEHLRKYVVKDASRANLGLGPEEFKVRFQGHGGLNLKQQRRLRAEEGSVQGANLLFLEMGTNDLAKQEYNPLVYICS